MVLAVTCSCVGVCRIMSSLSPCFVLFFCCCFLPPISPVWIRLYRQFQLGWKRRRRNRTTTATTLTTAEHAGKKRNKKWKINFFFGFFISAMKTHVAAPSSYYRRERRTSCAAWLLRPDCHIKYAQCHPVGWLDSGTSLLAISKWMLANNFLSRGVCHLCTQTFRWKKKFFIANQRAGYNLPAAVHIFFFRFWGNPPTLCFLLSKILRDKTHEILRNLK